MSGGMFIDTHAQAVQKAVQAFAEGRGLARSPTLEQELSAKMVAMLKGMDVTEPQFRHIATLILNDEKRIQSGTAIAERKAELAMHSVGELKTMLGTSSTTRVLAFVHALNAHLRAHLPDIHAVFKNNDARGGSLGSEPMIVKHLARHYRAHLAAADKASRAAQWPRKKAADMVSADIQPGGVLSGHVPANSVITRQREIEAAALRTPASYDDSVA